jgi:hypothetical protein
MTKKALWNQYVDKNPSFDGEGNITLSAAGLRKLFNQTWDIAFEQGEDEESPETSYAQVNSRAAGDVDYLKKIFGMF